jgi:uncharacterized damage-inducible protein DinB
MLGIHRVWIAILAGGMTLGVVAALAQDRPQEAPKAAAPVAAPAGPPGVRGEAYRNFDAPASKLSQLAEAIPADKYTWRPAEGVRSVSEVLLHVAAGNFNIPRRLGVTPPEGIDFRTLETSTTDKAKVIDLLKRSIDGARAAITNMPDADLEKTSKWFDGRMITDREVMFFLGGHDHEHLGQMIAYARSIGVVPPWSAKNN